MPRTVHKKTYEMILTEDFLHYWNKGLTDREISKKVGCAFGTVGHHRRRLRLKPNKNHSSTPTTRIDESG